MSLSDVLLFCFYLCPKLCEFLLDLWLLVSEDLILWIVDLRNIGRNSLISSALHLLECTLYSRSISYFFGIGKSIFIIQHKIDELMSQIYFIAVLGDDHGIIPGIGSLLRSIIAKLRIFADNIGSISGINNRHCLVS